MSVIDYDPFTHEHQQDPYPIYRRLRDEAPVYRAPQGVFIVTRYEHVHEVLKDPRRFSSDTRGLRQQGFGELSAIGRLRVLWQVLVKMRRNPLGMRDARMLILEDPPAHGVMRAVVNRGFTPRRIASLEKRIHELAHGLMDGIPDPTCFDFVSEIAIPLPVTVISELLGIPAEDRALFKRWSDQLIESNTGSAVEDPASSGVIELIGEMSRYMTPIMRARKRHPQEDLISVLMEASEGDVGLNEFEVILFILLLLVAGNETTTNLLGNTVDALLDHPDQLAKVASDPERIPALIEESLRYDGAVQRLRRVVTEDTALAGVSLPKGAELLFVIGSANRDERRFPDPDRLDVDRDTRGHVGFGFGNHFCLGASLARLEARAALEVVIPALTRLEASSPHREFVDSFVVRGRSRLELVAR